MEHINKTIVITFDDASHMIDFCKYADKSISKEFYDWYLNEKGHFFSKTGMLIIEGLIENKERLAVSFDFTDPDSVVFCSYYYKDQSVISKWIFKRQENLTMTNVTLDIQHVNINNLKKIKILMTADETDLIQEAKNLTKEVVSSKLIYKKGYRTTSQKEVLLKSINKVFKDINRLSCTALVYYTYALMYYVSKQEPEEITTSFNAEINKPANRISGIYKYTGYIDLRKNKTYRPLIKRDPNEPVREYTRHIQKWTVRGHYRRNRNGELIWIDPHTRGSGELEKRIYGTEDQKDINIIPKVFEVTRSKPADDKIVINAAKDEKPKMSETNDVTGISAIEQKSNSDISAYVPAYTANHKKRKSFYKLFSSAWGKIRSLFIKTRVK